VIGEEAKADSAKHVFFSGQTTHITIEEEHPGGEELNSDSPMEDDDFDMDVQPLPTAKHSNDPIVLFLSFSLMFLSVLPLSAGHLSFINLSPPFSKKIYIHVFGLSPARVVRWVDHLVAMCSRAWHALCAVGLRLNSSRGPGMARPPT